MMTPVERLFMVFDETAQLLQEELQCTYLEAVAETGENLFHGDVLQDEVSELNAKRLKKQYRELTLEQFQNEEIRKAFQLAVLKGMRQHVQPHHQMTPDAVSFVFGVFGPRVYALAFGAEDPRSGRRHGEFIDGRVKRPSGQTGGELRQRCR
ncbi:hypothetical protein LR69_02060 [Geobacillus sp. BCO2]|nr:hypothetical protein LR69_02060 [Geobacillus sp. BCO2]